jgi:hypothetical protein
MKIIPPAILAGLLLVSVLGNPVPMQATESWPTHWSAIPAAPPAGLENGDCSSYPDRRTFMEGQWQFAADGDLDNGRHIHLGLCVPDKIGAGIYRFDARVRTFHWNGRDATMLGLYGSKFSASEGRAFRDA